MRTLGFTLLLVGSLFAAGCRTSCPKEALQLSPESLAHRQLQTRRFDTSDESKILSACAGLLQDLGFNIDEGESELGLLVASKQRSAVETGQVVGAVILMALFKTDVPWDETQKLRACVVTRPLAGDLAVRVTFQRVVWNNDGKISKLEGLFDPEQYQEFFIKLSKAVFLEAHEI